MSTREVTRGGVVAMVSVSEPYVDRPGFETGMVEKGGEWGSRLEHELDGSLLELSAGEPRLKEKAAFAYEIDRALIPWPW